MDAQREGCGSPASMLHRLMNWAPPQEHTYPGRERQRGSFRLSQELVVLQTRVTSPEPIRLPQIVPFSTFQQPYICQPAWVLWLLCAYHPSRKTSFSIISVY